MAQGPADAPSRPSYGTLAAVRGLIFLPINLLVALGYLVRELPLLVQDLRSAVNDVARLAHHGELAQVLGGLARAASSDGELSELLRQAAALCKATAAAQRSPEQ